MEAVERSARPSLPPKPHWLREASHGRPADSTRAGDRTSVDAHYAPASSGKRKASDENVAIIASGKLSQSLHKRKSRKRPPISPLARENAIVKPEVDPDPDQGQSCCDDSSRQRGLYSIHIESCPCISAAQSSVVTSSSHAIGMKRATSWQTTYRDLLGSSSSPTISESPEDDDSDVDDVDTRRADAVERSGSRAISLPRDFFLSSLRLDELERVVVVQREGDDASLTTESSDDTSPNTPAAAFDPKPPTFTSSCTASLSPLESRPLQRSSRQVRLRQQDAVSLDDCSPGPDCRSGSCARDATSGGSNSLDVCTCRVQRSISTDSGLGRGRRRLKTVSVGNISSVYNLRVSLR